MAVILTDRRTGVTHTDSGTAKAGAIQAQKKQEAQQTDAGAHENSAFWSAPPVKDASSAAPAAQQSYLPVSRAIEESNALAVYHAAQAAVDADSHSIGDIYSNDFAAREADRQRREDNERRLDNARLTLQRLGLLPTAGQRISSTLLGAAQQTAAGNINAAATGFDLLGRAYQGTVEALQPAADWFVRTFTPNAPAPDLDMSAVPDYAAQWQGGISGLQGLADTLSEKSAENVDRAKTGLGGLGRLAVDAGVAGAQMLGDAAANILVPGASLPVMGARAFGSGAQEARRNGGTLIQQLGYGAATAAVEVLSEKMFNGLAGVYGGGGADEIVEKAIGKLAKSKTGQTALRLLASAGGEALEEVAAGAVEPALRSIYDGKNVLAHYNRDTAAEIVHDALVGGVLGLLGGAGAEVRSQFAIRNSQLEGNAADVGTSPPPALAGDRAGGPPPLSGEVEGRSEAVGVRGGVREGNDTSEAENGVERVSEGNAGVRRYTRSQIEAIAKDPMALAAMGIDRAGKTSTQLRAEVRAKLEGVPTDPLVGAIQGDTDNRISMEDFVNRESSVWNNVDYGDITTQAEITQMVHDRMTRRGEVVQVPEKISEQVAQSFPDLRGEKKSVRVPKLRQLLNELKTDLRGFLNRLKGGYEFSVNGNILEARLYDTGVREVMEKVTQQKAEMLYSTEAIFKNAQYLYSTPDYSNDPNVYRWNYFYTPVKMGSKVVGVRIAIRDMANPLESQIYHWGIKESASLDDTGRGQNRISRGVSSDTLSGTSTEANNAVDSFLPQNPGAVNTDYAENAENITESNQDMPSGMGAASAGFSGGPEAGEQVPTQNRTVTESQYLTEDEMERFAPGTHERVSEAASMHRAAQRMYTDAEGRLRPELTAEELLQKDSWTGEEQDMAQLALRSLIRQARQDGDWTKAAELAKAIEETGGTEAGRSLQARKKWVRTPEGIISKAADTLRDIREKNPKLGGEGGLASGPLADTLGQIADLAYQYDEAVRNNDARALSEVIRATSRTRRTGTLFTNKLGKTIEQALERTVRQAENGERGAMEFLTDHAANGLLCIANDLDPTKASDGLMTIRRLAMLSKASTIARNLVSNHVFDLTDTVSRDISVPLDMLLSKATGTRSVSWDRSWFSKAKRKGSVDGLARSILEVGLDVDAQSSQNRWEAPTTRTFRMDRSGVTGTASRLLSTWEKYEGYLLNSTDQWQKGGVDAEIQRGLDALYAKGLITDPSLEKGGATEALYRTFQDETQLSKLTVSMRRALNAIQWHGRSLRLGDMAIPFAQVPSNLGARAVEYSPIGLVDSMAGLVETLAKAKKGTLTAAEQAKAVQSFGRGLNGTALIALSTLLAVEGLLKVSGGWDDDDPDRSALEKASGLSGTQLNLDAVRRFLRGEGTDWRQNDLLMSIGFLDPFNAHMTIGSLISDDIRGGEVSLGNLAGDTAEGILESILELPLMSTFMDTADSFRYSSAETLGGRFKDAGKQFAASQASSFVPNILAGIAQGTDPYQRDAYGDSDPLIQALRSVQSKVPGWREQLPEKLDSYGQPRENAPQPFNFLNANLLPGSMTRLRTPQTEITETLDRLYQSTGDAGIYPDRKAPNSVSAGGEKITLTEAEKRQWQQTAGGIFAALAEELMQSERFGELTDEQAADILSGISSYANAKARQELIGSHKKDYSLSGNARTVEKAVEAGESGGVSFADYFLMKAVHDEIDAMDVGASEKATRFHQYLQGVDWLNSAQKEAVEGKLTYSSGFVAEPSKSALSAIAGGVELEDFYKLEHSKDHFDYDGSGAMSIQENAAAIESIRRERALSQADVEALWLAYYPDWVENAEKAGVDAGIYAVYKAATAGITGDKDANGKTVSGSKKEKIVAAIDALDTDNETKDKLYLAEGYAESGLRTTPWRKRG